MLFSRYLAPAVLAYTVAISARPIEPTSLINVQPVQAEPESLGLTLNARNEDDEPFPYSAGIAARDASPLKLPSFKLPSSLNPKNIFKKKPGSSTKPTSPSDSRPTTTKDQPRPTTSRQAAPSTKPSSPPNSFVDTDGVRKYQLTDPQAPSDHAPSNQAPGLVRGRPNGSRPNSRSPSRSGSPDGRSPQSSNPQTPTEKPPSTGQPEADPPTQQGAERKTQITPQSGGPFPEGEAAVVEGGEPEKAQHAPANSAPSSPHTSAPNPAAHTQQQTPNGAGHEDSPISPLGSGKFDYLPLGAGTAQGGQKTDYTARQQAAALPGVSMPEEFKPSST